MCSETTILVLDSDVQRRTQIHCALSLHGYKVLEAANPSHAEAICSVREISIDLVIRDAAEEGFEWPLWRPCVPFLPLPTPSECPNEDSTADFWRLPFNPERLLFQVSSALAQTEAANFFADDHEDIGMLKGNTGADRSNTKAEVGKIRAVLIVEDDHALRCAVSTILRRQGFPVIEAGDGTSAIALFRAHEAEIEVVLLDVTLPARSGREVFEILQQIRPGVKVIFTTAFSEEMVMSTISNRKPWAFVRKPYRAVDLVRLIARARTQSSG